MVRNLKRGIAVLLSIIMVIALAACGSTGSDESTDSQNTQSATDSDINTREEIQGKNISNENVTAAKPEGEAAGRILVVYFSWSGHLDSMAHWIADETGGDLYRVTAKEPYPENYNRTADRAKEEQDNDVRPEINIDITPEQMAQYDTVFFGFPVWWYDLPMCMQTFLESYDFTGKTIIPFFSHEGSSNGAGALPTLENLATGATVRSSDALSIRGGSVDGAENEVRDWVKGLEY